METSALIQFADQLANASTRRDAVKRLGALALAGSAVAVVSRSTLATPNHPPKHDSLIHECMTRCQRHRHAGRCHRRCRRNRVVV
jgi:hypothetical protein